MLRTFLKRIKNRLTASPARQAFKRQARLQVEVLEDRLVPATFGPLVLAPSQAALAFDSATGTLAILGGTAGAAVQVQDTLGGNLTVTINSRLHSSDPAAPSFDLALAGANDATLRRIDLSGSSADALTLAHLADTGDLGIHSDGSITVTGEVSTAGELALTSAGLLDIETAGLLQTRSGGSIAATADQFVNVGQFRADGAQRGSIAITAGDYLNAGTISASGSAGAGGTVRIDFTHSYIDTAAARTLASGTGSAGGQIAIDGGATGRLFSSGRFDATGSTGGQIDLFGKDILLVAASVDASGTAGDGGRVRIGGDYHGQNSPAPNAETVDVTGATTLRADGTAAAGRVVVWSETKTDFSGSVSAQGGKGRSGGLIEVSSHDQLTYGGTADAGQGGTLLLDPKDLVISTDTGEFPQFSLIDPDGQWGSPSGATTVLGNGNIVVVDPTVSPVGANGATGATYLFNGQTGALLSELVGACSTVVPLTNGNFVVGGLYGTVTWESGTGGVSGVVSATNSLIEGGSQYTTVSVTPLTNGNYVVHGINWNGDLGAVTWCNGFGPTTGTVSAANSLVGTNSADNVGGNGETGGVFALANGNYVVDSPFWNNRVGAVTWGNGTTGISGTISVSNSLVGSTGTDVVGTDGITVLNNGNYVVDSSQWNNFAGAVTWGNGTTGITGVVSAANSLVGSSSGDTVGSPPGFYQGVIALTNGNYVVDSYTWDGGEGAVTWGNGTTGITGTISAANSLVGNTDGNDEVGGGWDTLRGGVTALTNGNYVVSSPSWNSFRGAVTWGNGATGTVAPVSAANSLVGSNPDGTVNLGDQVGGGQIIFAGVTALANGNYVVDSPNWEGNNVTWNSGTGAVTWGNGTTGITGTVSAANSLVGTSTTDMVGIGGVTALTNGNYVVDSFDWNQQEGAVTWGSGTTGISGTISAANSLVGTTSNVNINGTLPDLVGADSLEGAAGVRALANGNYVVLSSVWNNGVGAATWGSGTTGIDGTVSGANSFINVPEIGDGIQDVTLPDGNYFIGDGTWFDGTSGTTLDGQSTEDAQNSIALEGEPLSWILPIGYGRSFVFAETVYFTDPNLITFALDEGQTITVTPDFITRTLNTGTNVTLQASDDITVDSPITEAPTGTAGSLTLQAGRSILLNASIDTAGGNLTLIANDSVADGVLDSDRGPGDAAITLAAGVTLNTGSGALSIDLKNSTDKTNNGSGVVTLTGITAATTTLSSASTLGISLDGTAQVNVTGTINLDGATLQLSQTAATAGSTVTILHSTAGVSGTFNGLGEGATVVAPDGTRFTISYQGNGGTDVVLTPARSVVAKLRLATSSSTIAGSAFNLVVTALDSAGHVVPGYTGTVSFRSSDQQAGLPATYTFRAADQGSHTFAVTLRTAGSQSLTVTDTVTGSVTGQASMQVTPATAAKLLIASAPPSSITAGRGFGAMVQVVDAYGNLATSFTGNVTLALANNPGGATLGGQVMVPVAQGQATFVGLTLTRSGSGYTLKASSTSLTTATTGLLTVVPGTATHFVVTSQPPANIKAGALFGLVVKVEDAFGNVVTGFTGKVALALASNPGNSILSGTVAVTATGGVATFSGLKLNRAGRGYKLRASGGLPTIITSPFNVLR